MKVELGRIPFQPKTFQIVERPIDFGKRKRSALQSAFVYSYKLIMPANLKSAEKTGMFFYHERFGPRFFSIPAS
jgi:hypothetical protein